MKVFRFLFRQSRLLMLLGVGVGFLSGAVYTALITVTHRAIDAGFDGDRTQLAWIFAVLCVAMPLTRTAAQIFLARLGQKALAELRLDLSRKLLASPLRRLEALGTPRILASLTDDALVLSNATTSIPMAFMHFTIMVSCAAYMVWLSWKLFACVFAAVAFGVLVFQLGMRSGTKFMVRAREVQDQMYKHFRALTEGAKELKLHHDRRQVFLGGELRDEAYAYHDRRMSAVVRFSWANSFVNLNYFLALGALVFAAPLFLDLEASQVTGFIFVLLFAAMSLDVIQQLIPALIAANVAYEKIDSLGVSLAREQEALAESVTAPAGWRTLRLDAVTYTYKADDDRDFTLGPLDLTLRSGEIVFLVGGNGSGKTTLGKLLTGLYVPDAGVLRLDGREVDEEYREEYRQLFSAIFADFFLFEKFLGLDAEGLDERAREHLRTLKIDHKVQVEGGALSALDLSQGQRKRLALLTAYLEDRAVYLFDEWAADQDPEFKAFFYHELLPQLKAAGKTVLVISHDDRYFEVGDRLIKLSEGQIESDVQVAAAN